jgi:hypothetical protein
MSRCVLPIALSALIGFGPIPFAFASASEPQLNFKIYNPDASGSSQTAPAKDDAVTEPKSSTDSSASVAPQATAPEESAANNVAKTQEATPAENTDKSANTDQPSAKETQASAQPDSSGLQAETPTAAPTANPPSDSTSVSKTADGLDTSTKSKTTDSADSAMSQTEGTASTESSANTGSGNDSQNTQEKADADSAAPADKGSGKTLQGYVRVVPVGTKIPIVMDTAVDSDTSQEGDEFSARTAEDLNIDGAVAVPAGSIIKGRIAQMNAPKHMDRSGSVALKFDTVTTPDNRQIPLVANIVAHGGVVHARRGLKDVAIDSATVMVPTLVGLGIGAIAGAANNNNSSGSSSSTSSISKPEAAMIGVGVGLVVGVAILLAKKGKKVDVRPGDELKIQLSEDLRMPMM